jgi:uncharacterized repeat protein (TIGR01451 family)
MKSRARLVGYLLVALILLGLLIASPRARAVPGQTRAGQGGTVPTLTPAGRRPTEPKPADTPPPTSESTPTVPAPSQTPAAALPATPAPAATLILAKEVAREQVWPGATVQYTLTVSNPGGGSARQVVVSDTLPEGLEPGEVLSGTDAAWNGRTLRAEVPVLPPGGRLVMAFTAVVGADVAPGAVLTNEASASAAGNLRAVATIDVVLPPVELPPTGGSTCRDSR